MDKNRYIEACRDETLPHLPMGRLFYLLHSNGFRVKPDDYIEMLKVTERFGSADIDETAKWICPIIATSETEQLRFYHVIEQYKQAEALQSCEETAIDKRIPRWFKIALPIFCITVLLLTVFLSIKRSPFAMEEDNRERTVQKNDSIHFDAANLLKEYPADTANINMRWQFEDGTVQSGFHPMHIFKQPGNFYIRRQFSSGRLRLLKSADSLLIHVCKNIPKLNIDIPAEAVTVKEPVNITASVTADSNSISFYQWTINDSVFTTTTPEVKGFVFLKEGDFPVECKAVVGDVSSPCTVSDNNIIQVMSNNLHYGAKFSVPRAGSYTGGAKVKWWVSAIFLLPAATLLVVGFLARKKTPPVAKEEKPASSTVVKGPYEIPFEQNDTKLIQPERDLRRAFVQMRYKGDEEIMALNVQSTIHSIIRSGGSPQLVFAPVVQQQEYLILIDRTNPKSMLTHFFTYLAKSMGEEGIPVVVFYYDKNFVCYNERHPSGISLQRVADTWHTTTLIILGKAHELVYGVYPVIEEKFSKELNRWQSKAIVTPQPLIDWATKEKLLQEYMLLVPADVSALQKLIPALREKIKLSKNLLQLTSAEQVSIRNTDFGDITELQNYLGGDEVLFQWLCATCIYPRLTWEVLVEIGKAILDKYGCPESLNYSSLLALCRISWMQQGVFPQATRLELLKRLKVENEIIAREKLLQLLNYSTVIYGESNHFFEEEKQRQVLTNQFILHASNSDRYNQFAGSRSRFKKLWQSDAILDVPVKKYLDKKDGDNWQTPVSDGNQSVGLSSYFNLHEITVSKKSRVKKQLSAAAAALLVAAWAFIVFGSGAEKLSPWISLTQSQAEAMISVQMKVIKNFRNCGDSLKQAFDQLSGFVEIGDKKFPLSYRPANATASFQIPYSSLTKGTGQVNFSWAANKSVQGNLYFSGMRLPDTVTVRCIDPDKLVKEDLYIRYNDTTGYREIEKKLGSALYRYSLSAEAVEFSDSSRIIYYETNQKGRADTIVKIVKRALHIDVKEEFIQELRTPPATPILFLNTSARASGDNTNDELVVRNKEDADDYHRLADAFLSKKQYTKAIEQYAKAVGLNPKDALAWYQTGICYEMLGADYTQKAIAAYNTAIRLNPNDASYYYRRASIAYEQKNYSNAITDYDRVISINTDYSSTQYLSSLYFRGRSKFFLNNVRGACEDFKKAADAGYSAGKKDYNNYCLIKKAPAKSGGEENNAAGETDNNPVQQQTIAAIPLLTETQLSDMLLDVSTGKKKATDFLTYLRQNDIAVTFNGTVMPFTQMCKELQQMKGITKINVLPTFSKQTNQVTNMVVSAKRAKAPGKAASYR